MSNLTPDQLEPGRRYRVEFDDCCVQGHFVGRFIEIRYVPDSPTDPTPFPDALVFDTGELGPVDWGQWTVTEEATG
jgi:hypothetical protein